MKTGAKLIACIMILWPLIYWFNRDEIASDSLSDENPRQVFKNCVGSKVHSADQMIIWMTQHRALKLHMYSLHLSLLSGLMAIMILFLFNSKVFLPD